MASTFETVVSEIHLNLDDLTTSKGLYRLSLDRHDKPHRLAWVPVGGRIEGPRTSHLRGQGGTQITGSPRVEPLVSKMLTVRCHIMTRTFEALEALHHDVLNAVDKALGKASVAGSFEIVSENDQRFGNALGGIGLIIQSFEWDLVVAKKLQTLATVTAQTHDCEIDVDL